MLPQQGVGILCQADEKKLPHSASACRDEATDLAGVEQLSSQSFLLSRLPLFCSFDKGSSLFCSVPIDLLGCWSGIGEAKRKPKELTIMSFFVFQILSQAAFISIPFRVF